MPLEHACFISFPKGIGKDSQFADHFYTEFTEQLATINKNLSVFKYDRCEHRRKSADWAVWIQRELCHSAMMIAICAPNYFNGSHGCISEFKGMEALIIERTNALGEPVSNNWLLGLRLKDNLPMPELTPYYVRDFLDCCASPKKVRQVQKYRMIVEELANRVYKHWCWLHDDGRHNKLVAANICEKFVMPAIQPAPPDPFPHMGGVP